MSMGTLFRMLVSTLWLGMLVSTAQAIPLSFSFSDPTGDVFGCQPPSPCSFPPVGVFTDVVDLLFNFDNNTGDFEILVTASATDPFLGNIIVNVNLFNPDTGDTASESFSSSLNTLILAPTLTVVLSGSDFRLLDWNAGDRVAACEGLGGITPEPCAGGLGAPNVTPAFSSGVINFASGPGSPASNQTARDSFQSAPPATIVAVTVPEPTTLALFGLGLAGLGFTRRKKA